MNPARLNYVQANNVCIQCHSQGQPLTSPIQGKYYDWPVGFHVGLDLKNFWKLEEQKLGETTFTHFPDGTAHKNRMQGNDFVTSVIRAFNFGYFLPVGERSRLSLDYQFKNHASFEDDAVNGRFQITWGILVK